MAETVASQPPTVLSAADSPSAAYTEPPLLTEDDIVFFSARGKGVREFSNLYELDVPIKYKGRTFAHTEAGYQSEYRCEEEFRDMFALPDGMFATLEGAEHVYNKPEEAARARKSWGSVKGRNPMSGIVAKMAVKPDRAKKLGIKLRCSKDDPQDLDEIKRIFKELLYLKFTRNPKLGRMLLETGDKILVEWDKGAGRQTLAGKPPLFSGILKDGKILGQNLMGRLLMRTRKRLVRENATR